MQYSFNNTPQQPGGITGGPTGNYMHVTAPGGPMNAGYLGVDNQCLPPQNYFTRMTTDVTTTGYDEVSVKFWWIGTGAKNSHVEMYYSTNEGTSWSVVTAFVANYTHGNPNYVYANNSNWLQQTVTIPEFANQAKLRIGFRLANGVHDNQIYPGQIGYGIDDFTITGTINVPPPVITTGTPTPAGPYCPGQTITVPFSVTDGPFNTVNVFTVQLSDATGSFTSPTAIGTLNETGNGSVSATLPATATAGSGYRVRVVASAPGVTGSNSTAFQIGAAPTASILNTSTSSVCENGIATLTAQGTGTIQWSSSPTSSGFSPISGATSSSYTTPPLTTSTWYQVSITNACGTTPSNPWQVTLTDVVNIPLSHTPQTLNLCNGPVTVTAVGAFNNLAWSTGQTNTPSVTISEPVTVRVTGRDAANCPAESAELTFILTEPLLLAITNTLPIILCNNAATLTASSGFSDYVWSNEGNGNPLTIDQIGVYSVTATDGNGCISESEPVEVVAGTVSVIPVTPANPAICNNQPVTLTAAEGYSNYVWSTGAQGRTITVTQGGVYSVSAGASEEGCAGESEPVHVAKSNMPIANFNYNQSNGYTITFNNTTQNGMEFLWSFGGLGTSPTPNASFTFPDSGPYYVTLYTNNGCGDDSVTKLVMVVTVGFAEIFSEYEVLVFPNPAESDFNLRMTNRNGENIRLELLDLTGRLLYGETISEYGTVSRLIPATHLGAGYYFLRIQAGNLHGVVKLVKRG